MAGDNGRSWLSVLLVIDFSQIVTFFRFQIFADDLINGPHVLSTIRADLTKPNPKSGVVQMDWNLTGNLLLVRFGVFYKVSSLLNGSLSMFTR